MLYVLTYYIVYSTCFNENTSLKSGPLESKFRVHHLGHRVWVTCYGNNRGLQNKSDRLFILYLGFLGRTRVGSHARSLGLLTASVLVAW